MTPETTTERTSPVRAAALAATGDRTRDKRSLYTTVVYRLLRELSDLPAGMLESATRDKPPTAGRPWDAAIAAGVEYACQGAHVRTPDWCDKPEYEQHPPIAAGGNAAERARALYQAPAAYVRHGILPNADQIRVAAGRGPAALWGDTPGIAETTPEVRATASRVERWLLREGLRGHVYLTSNGPLWFATNIHGHPRVMGPQPVARAFAESLPGGLDMAGWIDTLDTTLKTGRTELHGRPAAWWDTPSLVITGAPAELGLALAAGFADEIEPDRLQRLTWATLKRSVDSIDRLVRTVTGQPLNARMRTTVAAAVDQKLSAGSDGWVARWIAAAEKTLAEGGDPRTLLKRTPESGTARWPGTPRTNCGELEADIAPHDAPQTEHGRLWIRRSRDRGAQLVLLERDDPALDCEIEDDRDIAAAVLEAEDRRKRTPRNADGAWDSADRPGWTNIVGLATYMATQAYDECERVDIEKPRIADGRLKFSLPEDARPHLRGVIAVSEALSAETCELCGGKGDPVADADGRQTGCRCAECRPADARLLERPWPDTVPQRTAAEAAEDPEGRWRRLESESARRLMAADDDAGRGRWTAHAEGWCGVVRAMFLTLRGEQEPRPEDPEHRPFRLGVMKSKWGMLRVESALANDYQQGVIETIELMSGWTCEECGHPAKLRNAHYVRPECDDCWNAAGPKDHAEAAENAKKCGPYDTTGPDWYRGVSLTIPRIQPDADSA